MKNPPRLFSFTPSLVGLALLALNLFATVACSDQPKITRIEQTGPSRPVDATVQIVKGINNNSIVTIKHDWRLDWRPLFIKDTVGTARYRYALVTQEYPAQQNADGVIPMRSVYEFDCPPRDLHLTSSDFGPANYKVTLIKGGNISPSR